MQSGRSTTGGEIHGKMMQDKTGAGVHGEKRETVKQVLEEGGRKVIVEESKSMATPQLPAESVTLRKIEKEQTEELLRVVDKIAKTKEEILLCQKEVDGHTKIMNDVLVSEKAALDTSSLMEKKEKELEERKAFFLSEERRLELERVEKHREAVKTEEEIAATIAEKIRNQKAAENARNLLSNHNLAINRERELMRAHELQLRTLEEEKKRLEQKKVDVEVVGHRIHAEAAPVDIKVAVAPRAVPEFKLTAEEIAAGSVATAHVEDKQVRVDKPQVAREAITTQHKEKVVEEKIEMGGSRVERKEYKK